MGISNHLFEAVIFGTPLQLTAFPHYATSLFTHKWIISPSGNLPKARLAYRPIRHRT
jgi:hypothetical protein